MDLLGKRWNSKGIWGQMSSELQGRSPGIVAMSMRWIPLDISSTSHWLTLQGQVEEMLVGPCSSDTGWPGYRWCRGSGQMNKEMKVKSRWGYTRSGSCIGSSSPFFHLARWRLSMSGWQHMCECQLAPYILRRYQSRQRQGSLGPRWPEMDQ